MQCIVYRYLNADNEVTYVGKTTRKLIQRVREHKKEDCGKYFSKIEFAELDNEAKMNQYELYYINKYKPIYNTASVHEGSPVELPELKWIEFDFSDAYGSYLPNDIYTFNKSKLLDNFSNKYNTVKDISNKLGINKQRVYRFVKKRPHYITCIDSSTKRWYFDDESTNRICSEIMYNEYGAEETCAIGAKEIDDKKDNEIDMVMLLQQELREKDKIIKSLNETIQLNNKIILNYLGGLIGNNVNNFM